MLWYKISSLIKCSSLDICFYFVVVVCLLKRQQQQQQNHTRDSVFAFFLKCIIYMLLVKTYIRHCVVEMPFRCQRSDVLFHKWLPLRPQDVGRKSLTMWDKSRRDELSQACFNRKGYNGSTWGKRHLRLDGLTSQNCPIQQWRFKKKKKGATAKEDDKHWFMDKKVEL